MAEPVRIIIDPIDDDYANLTINPSTPSEVNVTIDNDPSLLPFHLADHGLVMLSQTPVPLEDGTYEMTAHKC